MLYKKTCENIQKKKEKNILKKIEDKYKFVKISRGGKVYFPDVLKCPSCKLKKMIPKYEAHYYDTVPSYNGHNKNCHNFYQCQNCGNCYEREIDNE